MTNTPTTKQLTINMETGRLAPVDFHFSAHHDERPAGIAIDMIVVHNISLPPGQFGGDAIQQFFCGQLDHAAHPYFSEIATLRVSSHLLITRTGSVLQFVPFHQRAWHAGESSFKGRMRCNDFSIGIELEGTDELPFEPVQYQRLAEVIKVLRQAYPHISHDRIVGHSDIAPLRKTDPGPAFDWDYLRGKLA